MIPTEGGLWGTWTKRLSLAAFTLVLSMSGARAHVVCTALADAATGRVLVRDGDCESRVTPASTFKIAISLMGFDAGFLTDEHAPALVFRPGDPDWLPEWRTTIDPASWIARSVVWYSWRVTRALGEKRFAGYVSAFRYGNEDVSGHKGRHDGLTQAWLGSSLRISPLEQLAFLEALLGKRLPVSERAVEMTTRITAAGALPGGWELHGKTGSGFPVRADGSDDRDHAFGWFVGWAVKDGRTIVFARLIQEDRREKDYPGPRARAAMTDDLPGLLAGAS